jgi:CRP/FNR family transcriptional regulator, cyclic AMP receptor protein
VNMRRLGELPLFQGLDEDSLRAAGAAVVEESVEEGRIIVREGDYSTDLTIIDEGTAIVEHDGQELAQLGPGEMFGELGLIQKAQRNATVRAGTDMRLIHLTKFDLNRLRGRAPQVLDRINEIIEKRSA